MNNEVNNNVNNNIPPKKKSNAWIIVLCIVLGCIVLIPLILIGLVMLLAAIFIPKGIEAYNEAMENAPEISIHVDGNEDEGEIDIHFDGNGNQTNPGGNGNIKEEVKYDGIVNDTSINDDMKLAETLMERYKYANTDCISVFDDFLGKTTTVTPNSISKEKAAEYIFNLFIILHDGEDLDYENATPLEDTMHESKLKFSKEDYIKYGKILFGKNYNAELVDVGHSHCIKFEYDKTNNYYKVIILAGCGGTCSPETYFLHKLVDAKKEGNKFYAYYRLIYRDYNPNTDEILFYTDKEHKNQITVGEDYEPDYSKGELYVVEFEKNGTAYSFVKAYEKQ